MEKQLIVNLYNPANFTRQELIERFIVRIAQFRRLYNDLASSLMDKPEQQYLLLARRGMGKTTMLLRLAYEMKQDATVNAWMTPVVFHEEEYRIDELELLWERVAEYMEEHDPMAFGGLKQQMADLHPALKDQPALFEEQAFDLLLARLRQHGKKLVLFIDNFGDIYQRFKRWELQRLRTVLQTTPDLRIVGATAIVLNDMYDAAHPFYEFFKVVKLEGLNAADTRTLLLALAKRQQDERVAEIVRRQPQRVEVMRRLTGGVIRTVILLYEVFAEQREGKALRDLEIIADRTTPLYQDRMKELSDQQKKIVDAVARAWDGVTAGEIATATRLSAKHVSSQLQVLTGNGTIEQRLVAGSRQRVYLISERFFNIWYLMRFGRSDQRVLWLTRFLEAWCENAGELADRARRHLTALKDGGYDPKSAYLLSSALARAKGIDKTLQHELVTTTQGYLRLHNNDLSEQLSPSDLMLLEQTQQQLQQQNPAAALATLKQMKEPEWAEAGNVFYRAHAWKEVEYCMLQLAEQGEGYAFYNLGYLYQGHLAQPEKAEHYYLQAIEKGNVDALNNLGNLYAGTLQSPEKAEHYYLQAIEKGNANAMYNLANLYANVLQLPEKAEHCYLQAIEKGHVDALNNLAILYAGALQSPEKAERYHLQAIEKGDTNALNNLANLYAGALESPEKAERYYLQAIEKGQVDALNNLAVLYSSILQSPEKAEHYYLQAIEKGHTGALYNLANLYAGVLESPEKAERYYLQAIEKGDVGALNDLAILYAGILQSPDKAEHYYLQAIEKGHVYALNNLAVLYSSVLQSPEKAEEYYFKAIEKGHTGALYNLANLYAGVLESAEKAEHYYLQAIEKGDTNALNNLANLYAGVLESAEKAEHYYLQAIEKGDTNALNNLANLYAEALESPEKAEHYYLQAIEKGDTNALNNLANLYAEALELPEKAEHYYLQAIEKGDADAMYNLANLYAGVLESPEKAEHYYLQAIEKGDADAMYNLANLYANILQSPEKAEHHYLQAIEKGHVDALNNLAMLYAGALQSPEKAEHYYLQAIEKGDADALNNLAILYAEALESPEKAEHYYLQAIEKGHTDALYNLANLYAGVLESPEKAEHYYLQVIEKGDADAFNNLAYHYFTQNKEQARALEFTEKALASAPDNAMVAHTAATVFLWADHTDRATALAPRFLYDADFLDTNETDVVNFLLLCLAKAQYAFVEEAFTGPAGQSVQLQDRLKPVWYTLAYLRREEDPLTYARMGSEVEDTVKEMVAKAQAYQEKYKVNIR